MFSSPHGDPSVQNKTLIDIPLLISLGLTEINSYLLIRETSFNVLPNLVSVSFSSSEFLIFLQGALS